MDANQIAEGQSQAPIQTDSFTTDQLLVHTQLLSSPACVLWLASWQQKLHVAVLHHDGLSGAWVLNTQV